MYGIHTPRHAIASYAAASRRATQHHVGRAYARCRYSFVSISILLPFSPSPLAASHSPLHRAYPCVFVSKYESTWVYARACARSHAPPYPTTRVPTTRRSAKFRPILGRFIPFYSIPCILFNFSTTFVSFVKMN